jgi:alkylation response protein AidB-like acyl-CoA dehydrogenase
MHARAGAETGLEPEERAVNVGFSSEEESFRSEVRVFLEDYRDLDGFFGQGHKWKDVKELFCAMGERGWLALTWPEEHGGLARYPAYEYILWDEVAYARAARNPLAAGIVARTLIRSGSDDQKRRWLPPIRTGELHFSLAYSEPEAGSDLASLRVRADREGDEYVITGQKCWQSYAQDMDYFWLLARTGTQESRGRGLSLFICDKQSPGVSVGPLPTLDDDQLNEVHFDSVRVPVENLVGPENGAWAIMGEALADERHIQFPPGRVRRDLEEMVEWVKSAGLAHDPVVRRTLADLGARVAEVEIQGLRVLDAMQRGVAAAVEAAANKVLHTLVCQEIARAVLDLGGNEALVTGSRPELLWRQSMWETIGGGTTEIMLGVIAKQGLGLGARR